MANGVAVKLAPVTSELPAISKPFDPADLGGPEGWVGAILVAFTDVSARALLELETGGQVAETTKMLGADLMARLYMLQQRSLGYLDFAATVRQQGRLQLRTRHGASLSAEAVDEITSLILATVARMAAGVRSELH